jgi:acid phosphatase type 7
MKNKGRSILIALALLILPLLVRAEYAPFAIISDTHIGMQESVYIAFIRAVEEEKIHTIIHTGDVINRPGDLMQWARFVQITGAGKTVHVAPGNHDIDDKESLATFLKYFPEAYHSFSDGDTLFIILNSELPGQKSRIAGEQLAWLKTELDRRFRYKFVFLHEPLFPVVTLHGLDRHKAARDQLHQLFVQTGVSLVVAGHDHLYDRNVRDGITYVIAGGGGGVMAFFLKNGDFHHYIFSRRNHDGYLFTVRDVDGNTRDQFSISH